MPLAIPAFALALPLGSQARAPSSAPAPTGDPCRRSHCPLAGEDLAFLLVLAETHRWRDSEITLLLPPNGELRPFGAARTLTVRHRQGHGGWPATVSSSTLVEQGLAPCDPLALDALLDVTTRNVQRDRALDASEVADWLERNGRFAEAEALLIAELPAGSAP